MYKYEFVNEYLCHYEYEIIAVYGIAEVGGMYIIRITSHYKKKMPVFGLFCHLPARPAHSMRKSPSRSGRGK